MNKKVTCFIIITIIVIYHHAFAEITLSPAEQALENDFLGSPSGIVELQKPMRLYHYFNPALQNGELWPTYQKIADRYRPDGQIQYDLAYGAGVFWNLENHQTKLVNGGPGYYLAIEPQVSSSYGESFYIIDFPAGTKYIDVSDPTWNFVSKIKLNKNTIDLLLAEKIISVSDISRLGLQKGYFTRISMQNIASEKNAAFRKSISKIFDKNNITLIQYSWERTKKIYFANRVVFPPLSILAKNLLKLYKPLKSFQ